MELRLKKGPLSQIGDQRYSKKVTKSEDSTWQWDRCNQEFKECDYMYLLQCQVQDNTRLIWVTAFQEAVPLGVDIRNHKRNGKEPEPEKYVGVCGYGYPALIALNLEKGAYAPLKSSFKLEQIMFDSWEAHRFIALSAMLLNLKKVEVCPFFYIGYASLASKLKDVSQKRCGEDLVALWSTQYKNREKYVMSIMVSSYDKTDLRQRNV